MICPRSNAFRIHPLICSIDVWLLLVCFCVRLLSFSLDILQSTPVVVQLRKFAKRCKVGGWRTTARSIAETAVKTAEKVKQSCMFPYARSVAIAKF